MMYGKIRRVETNAVQDEKWVMTPDGWKRGDINEVKNGAAFVDGKRVDTNKPYDPEAPPYDPYNPHPRRPVTEALLPIVLEKGVEAAVQSYRALKQSNDYYVSESQLDALGYRLLGMKTEFPNDRVLLIVGSGHLTILRDFARDSPQFCLVDAEAYLK